METKKMALVKNNKDIIEYRLEKLDELCVKILQNMEKINSMVMDHEIHIRESKIKETQADKIKGWMAENWLPLINLVGILSGIVAVIKH